MRISVCAFVHLSIFCMEALLARVQVLNETTTLHDSAKTDVTLWFQWCRYLYDDGQIQYGYRFIWKRPSSEGGAQQAARGQARIPSIEVLEQLVRQAKQEGWGDYDDDRISSSAEAHWARGLRPSP